MPNAARQAAIPAGFQEAGVIYHPRLGVGRVVQTEETMAGESPLVYHPRLGYGRPTAGLPEELPSAGELEIVGATDDRIMVANTLEVPFRWICHLDLFFSDPDRPNQEVQFPATGTLIGNKYVLTAGHCLYDEILGSLEINRVRQRVRRIRVIPGLNGVDSRNRRISPLGAAWSQGVLVPSSWQATLDMQHDYGLIILQDALGARPQSALGGQPLGFWGCPARGAGTRIGSVTLAALQGQPVNLSGYPADKCGTQPRVGSASQAALQACPMDKWASKQFRAFGQVIGQNPPRLLLHNLDTKFGHSGSPVWLRWQDYRFLVAVHTGWVTAGVSNRAVALTAEVWQQLQTWMTAAPATTGRPTLRHGSQGQAVVELQTRLNRWLAANPAMNLQPLTVDGIFGNLTLAAVRAFQQAHGLAVDGIVGPQTWAQLERW